VRKAPSMASTAIAHPVDGQRYAMGGRPRGNADASADSWSRVLEFLERTRAGR
jgi:hypothetical protein